MPINITTKSYDRAKCNILIRDVQIGKGGEGGGGAHVWPINKIIKPLVCKNFVSIRIKLTIYALRASKHPII